MRDLFVLMASYNTWMNAKLYKAARELPAEAVAAERGAFFGSILGTLNHVAVGDRIWLQRFAQHSSRSEALGLVLDLPKPASLDEILFPDLNELAKHRVMLDEVIECWAKGLTDADLSSVLSYTNSKGVHARKRFSSLVLHFFNHQTHHRGQVTTLLSQLGKDVGVTDLLALLPNESEA